MTLGTVGTASGWDDGDSAAESLLAQLPVWTRNTLFGASTSVTLHAGRWLFRAGDPADAMYIVRSGRLEVISEGGSHPSGEVLEVLGPGAALGELALLTGSTRSASVRARRDSELMRLSATDFASLMRKDKSLALALARVLGRLLAGGGTPRSQEGPRPAVIALVPLQHEPGLPGHMVSALEHVVGHGRVATLGPEDAAGAIDERYPTDADAAFAQLLERREHEYDTVVLHADILGEVPLRAEGWTKFCLRSADRLVLAVGPDPQGLRRWESLQSLASLATAERDLCFLDVGVEPLVARWLGAVLPGRHHFVQTDPDRIFADDVARMIRRLTGRSVGVVLSGGGARGFAHLGALAALREAGVLVDRVGGCSMGAVMAALVAQRRSHDEIVDACRRYFIDSKPLNDYTIPRTALVHGRKLRASLSEALGPGSIETLPMDFFCISADLIAADTVVHRSGPLWKAVLASLSIPGLLPPVRMDGRLLVDGGILNNLPVDVMVDAGEGPVVAVDVMRDFASEGTRRSSRFRRQRVRRGSGAPVATSIEPPPPPIAETLTRATVLSSWRQAEANRDRAALVITVPADQTGLLAFDRLDAMVDAGRTAARTAMQTAAALDQLTGRHRTGEAAGPS